MIHSKPHRKSRKRGRNIFILCTALVSYFLSTVSNLKAAHQTLPIKVDENVNFANINSLKLLHRPKLGNLDDALMTSAMAHAIILNVSPMSRTLSHTDNPLRMSMCVEGSRFLNWKPLTDGGSSEERSRALHTLAFRLGFLAIHDHQHRHARKEAEQRVNAKINLNVYQKMVTDIDVVTNTPTIPTPGIFDYECPDAKFVVSSFPSNAGLGYSVRHGPIQALQAAMTSDRVALFVNGAPTGPKMQQSRWNLGSCERNDMQCFFMPVSPCTITVKELEEASVLTNDESCKLGKSMEVLEKYKLSRVIIPNCLSRGTIPTWNWKNRVEELMDGVHSLLKRNSTDSDMFTPDNRRLYGSAC